jgi:hypothetical protein
MDGRSPDRQNDGFYGDGQGRCGRRTGEDTFRHRSLHSAEDTGNGCRQRSEDPLHDCWCLFLRGGIQIEPANDRESLRGRYIAAIEGVPSATESDGTWIDAARLPSTSWRLTVYVETSRLTVTMPEPLRRLNEVPGTDGTVVVFAFGNIWEICDAPTWRRYVQQLAGGRTALIGRAITDLEGRR